MVFIGTAGPIPGVALTSAGVTWHCGDTDLGDSGWNDDTGLLLLLPLTRYFNRILEHHANFVLNLKVVLEITPQADRGEAQKTQRPCNMF